MSVIESGTIVANRYQLTKLLGQGGMGEVWAASHMITRKSVAIKLLKPDAASCSQAIERFRREARAACAVKHPNVVQVHDILETEDGAPVMVMDLLSGESLAHRLERTPVIELGELARILVPIISAIGTVHAAGIVHRDLKPDNIFLETGPDGDLVPKVLDFGIAKLTAQKGPAAATSNLTQTGAMLGTPYYMAPEQAFGEKSVDHRVDIWAMGVILYECLSGRRPVDGENLGQLYRVLMSGTIRPLREVAPHLPDDVIDTVTRMLSTDRSKRPDDMREVFTLLRRYTTVRAETFSSARPPAQPSSKSEGILEHTGSPFSVTTKGDWRKRRLLGISAAMLVIGVAAGVTGLRHLRATSGNSDLLVQPSSSGEWINQDAIPPPILPTVPPSAIPSAAEALSSPGAPSSSSVPPRRFSNSTHGATSKQDKQAVAQEPSSEVPPEPKSESKKLPGGVVGELPF